MFHSTASFVHFKFNLIHIHDDASIVKLLHYTRKLVINNSHVRLDWWIAISIGIHLKRES